MKLFDNVESHKTRICGIWHFGKELSILDPCNESWSYDQRMKSSIPSGSCKSVDFPLLSSSWRFKNEHLIVKDHFTLWSNLKERYDHQNTVILPKVWYDWMHMRLQDFKTISEYNFTLFKINSQLKLCEEKNHKENFY